MISLAQLRKANPKQLNTILGIPIPVLVKSLGSHNRRVVSIKNEQANIDVFIETPMFSTDNNIFFSPITIPNAQYYRNILPNIAQIKKQGEFVEMSGDSYNSMGCFHPSAHLRK